MSPMLCYTTAETPLRAQILSQVTSAGADSETEWYASIRPTVGTQPLTPSIHPIGRGTYVATQRGDVRPATH